MNDTLVKFGYPQSVIKSYQFWSVLLRPQQVTLGSLVLANHSEAQALGSLDTKEIAELSIICQDIESVLTRCFKYDKINYLMLMMVDPHVHFHVIPRYQQTRKFESLEVNDNDWPGPPNLGKYLDMSEMQMKQLQQHIQDRWTHD